LDEYKENGRGRESGNKGYIERETWTLNQKSYKRIYMSSFPSLPVTLPYLPCFLLSYLFYKNFLPGFSTRIFHSNFLQEFSLPIFNLRNLR
jgi:hypothetical protein